LPCHSITCTDDAAASVGIHLAAYGEFIHSEALDDTGQHRLSDAADEGRVEPRQRIEGAVPEPNSIVRVPIGVEAEGLRDVLDAPQQSGGAALSPKM
jgi:hypothetical protein